MKVVDGHIIEATDRELYKFWSENLYEVISYTRYKSAMKAKGVIVHDDTYDDKKK